jgi:hypothetical protein
MQEQGRPLPRPTAPTVSGARLAPCQMSQENNSGVDLSSDASTVRILPEASKQGFNTEDAAQPLATTNTGRHTRAVPRCSGRSVCGDAGLAMGAPASARGTAKQEFQRRCSKAMHAEHADGDGAAAPPVARCRQRLSVDIECVGDGLGAARKHQRVLRASPYCICAGCFSVLRRHSHATHPFPAGCRKFVARCSDFEG